MRLASRPGPAVPPNRPPETGLRLTVILDSLGKPPLQSLVHGLQPRGNILVSDRSLVRAHQLLQGREHLSGPTPAPPPPGKGLLLRGSGAGRPRGGHRGRTRLEGDARVNQGWGRAGPAMRGLPGSAGRRCAGSARPGPARRGGEGGSAGAPPSTGKGALTGHGPGPGRRGGKGAVGPGRQLSPAGRQRSGPGAGSGGSAGLPPPPPPSCLFRLAAGGRGARGAGYGGRQGPARRGARPAAGPACVLGPPGRGRPWARPPGLPVTPPQGQLQPNPSKTPTVPSCDPTNSCHPLLGPP